MAQGEGSPNNLNYWSAVGRRLSAGLFAALSVDGKHIRMSIWSDLSLWMKMIMWYSDTYTHIRPSSIPGAYHSLRTRRRVRAAVLVLPLKLHGWREKNRDGKAEEGSLKELEMQKEKSRDYQNQSAEKITKGVVHLKNEHSVIICFTFMLFPVWLPFSVEHKEDILKDSAIFIKINADLRFQSNNKAS